MYIIKDARIRKGIFMLQMLYPDEYLDSTYTIDFKKLYKDGYRGILFDIDNTLVPHGHRQIRGRLLYLKS